MSEVDRLRQNSELAAAETLGSQIVEVSPENPAAWVALGRVKLDQYLHEDALSCFERAGRCPEPTSMTAAWQVAALSRLRRFDEAREASEAGLERFPRSPDILVAHARAYIDQYEWAASLPLFDQALEIDPFHAQALEWRISALLPLRRFDQAEAAAQDAIERCPDEPDLLVQMGWVYVDQFRYEEALAWFERALGPVPHHSWALRSRVIALRRLRQFAEAETTAREGIELRPGDTTLMMQMAWLCDDQLRYDDVLVWCDRALDAQPRNTSALAKRVSALRYLRKFDRAEAVACDAVDRCPDEPDLLIQLGWVHGDQFKYEEALNWFRRALEIDPRHSWALGSRVAALRQLRWFDEAEQAAREGIERRPDEPDLLMELGWVHSDQLHHDEALACYDRALKVDPYDASALEWRGTALRWLRRFDEAQIALQEAIELRPDQPGLLVEMGWVHSDQLEHEEALAWFSRALDINPDHGWALRSRAAALRSLRRFDQAETAAQEAIDRRPLDVYAILQMGWLLDDQFRLEDALTWYARALDVDPRDALALRWRIGALRSLRRFDQAEAATREAIQLRPDEPDLLVAMGWVHGEQFQHEEALTWFRRALKISSRHIWALQSQVAALRLMRRFDQAETAAREAIELCPDEAGIMIGLGWVYGDQRRYEEALTVLQRVLDIDPRHSWALRSRVLTLRRLRRYDEASAAAQEAIDRRPGDLDALLWMGWVYSHQLRHEEALVWYDRALESDPRYALAWEWRATASRMLRRFEEAEAAVREAIKLRPNEPGPFLEMGWVHTSQFQYAKALHWFERALEADPRHAQALEWRVTALRRLRRFDDAEAAARKAIELRPDNPDLLLEMGYVCDDQLRYEESLGWFERSLALDPGHVQSITARSGALRSLRRFDEAAQQVTSALERMPWERTLRSELVWIHHDNHQLDEAERVVSRLRADGVSPREQAEAISQTGWVRFAAGEYRIATEFFRAAHEKNPENLRYRFGLAWCLVRQSTPQARDEAEQLCFSVLDKNPMNHSAHTCLGVLNYQRQRFAQAEQHFRKAVELDDHHASHVDLGAFYSQLGRFDEAEQYLNLALARDWYDAQAHVELGHLQIQRDIEDPSAKHGADAVRHFRQARQIDPANGSASLGLALALTRSAGDFTESEEVLQQALRRPDCDLPRWHLLVAVAKLLIGRGDATQGRQFYTDALAHAQEAIARAADEAEPYFVAAVARYKLAETAGDFPAKPAQRRRAVRDLRRCVQIDPGNVEAQRSLRIMEESLRITRSSTRGSVVVVSIGVATLLALWIAFFVSEKITGVMLMTLTPVLVGLVVIGLVLPFLIRLKLPGGVEADLTASIRQISSGPTGEETFGPGRFNVTAATTGPKGQLPRF
ncbi:tetratricopeptide repeat protein [Amycolatopsis sp. NPDC098790]|uniref:tetratricopeptide repeat protein n=1 Tax=Amycolatopsis sp. NPDC098790 TaxID=3363939 RepID=UPI0037FB67B6